MNLRSKLWLFKRIGFSQYFVNLIFQKLFMLNRNVKIPLHFTSKIISFENFNFNNDVTTLKSFAVSGHCYFEAQNGIIVGKSFLFAPGIKIISSNHDPYNINNSLKSDPVIIGDHVWIGTNAVILPSVRIGNNCIIGAGSVVTKSFPEDNLIIAGNPAKIIKRKQPQDNTEL